MAALPMEPRGVAARWRRAAAAPGEARGALGGREDSAAGRESHAARLAPTGECGLSACPGAGCGSRGAGRARKVTGVPRPARESASRGLLPSAGMALSSRTAPARPLSPHCPEGRALLSGVGGVEGRTGHSYGALPAMPGPHQKHQVSERVHYRGGGDCFEAG